MATIYQQRRAERAAIELLCLHWRVCGLYEKGFCPHRQDALKMVNLFPRFLADVHLWGWRNMVRSPQPAAEVKCMQQAYW